MKKFYFCMSLLFAFFGALSAQTDKVVTDKGHYITSVEELSEGMQVLLYCQGYTHSSSDSYNGLGQDEYGSRNAFIMEDNAGLCWLSRKNFVPGNRSTAAYIWTLESVEDNGRGGLRVRLKAPSGNYLSTFESRNMQASTDAVGGYFDIDPMSEEGDSIFTVGDENMVFLNGQNIDLSGSDPAKCVGWDAVGGNSNYMIYIPTIEEKDTYTICYNVYDVATEDCTIPGWEEAVEDNMLVGEEVVAPAVEHYDFVRAIDIDTDEEVELPYTVTEESDGVFFIFYYECWPLLNVSFVDEDGNTLATAVEKYYRKGSKLDALPSIVGYSLTEASKAYEDYTVTGDATITVVYRKDASSLPFVPTTVADGKFAENTSWYRMKIRGSKYAKISEDGLAVNCGTVEEVNDSSLWAFEGSLEEGFKVYNKQFGTTHVLWATDGGNATQLVMTPVEEAIEPNTFDLSNNGDGYNFKLHETENSYINDHAGNGVLKFWANDAGVSDAGSRLVFEIWTEEMAEAYRFAPYVQYLNAEGCVNGWTAEQLAEMKAAYADKDVEGCEVAAAALAEEETIAFDASKAYVILSAYKGYILDQPGKTYALCATDTTLMWKELNAEDKLFQWGFDVATDSTFYLENVALNTYAAGYRFGGNCPLVSWSEPAAVEPVAPWSKNEGEPADFKLEPASLMPAAFYLVHEYQKSVNASTGEVSSVFVTLAGFGENGITDASAATEGQVKTYNTREIDYNNAWRLKAVGDFTTGLGGTVVAAPGQQKNVIYDLSGRRVAKAVKGLYIINGKKVLVK